MEEEKNQSTDNTKDIPEEPEVVDSPEKKAEPEVKEIHHHHYKEKSGISWGRVYLGIIIILIGVFYLAQSIGWLENVSFDIWQLWPLLIVIVGLSMLTGRGWVSGIISLVVLLVILGIVGLLFITNSNVATTETQLSFDIQEGAESAVLKIATGGGEINLQAGSEDMTKLITGQSVASFLELTQDDDLDGSVQTISLTGQTRWDVFDWGKNNELNLDLNRNLPMNIDIDSGAVSMDVDLTQVQAEKVDIDTGASSVDLAIGDLSENVSVNIDAGVSSVDITLPEGFAARMDVDSGLTSKNLEGFKKADDDTYQTDNYGEAEKKIELDLSLGVSSLNIDWK